MRECAVGITEREELKRVDEWFARLRVVQQLHAQVLTRLARLCELLGALRLWSAEGGVVVPGESGPAGPPPPLWTKI